MDSKTSNIIQHTNIEQIENNIETQKSTYKFKFGTRHVQSLFLFAGLIFGYFLRVNISVAIVSMTKSDTDFHHFDWNIEIRNLILSSFFWGYVVAQIPSGILSQKFGPKIIFAGSTALCGIITAAIPFISTAGDWQAMIAVRVFVGLFQGTLYPCVHTLLARWVPKPERGVLTSFIYSGAQIGTVIMLAVSGYITSSPLGWPGIFYISGGISFIWAVLYYIFGSDSPQESKLISKDELYYIEQYTGGQDTKKLEVPWASFFTSKPFYALLLAHCGFTWGFYTLLTEIPTYLSKVLELDLSKNSLLAALPYLTMWIISLIVSPISDVLINKSIISVEKGRKIFNSIGQWVPMVCLIALSYMTKENTELAIFFLTVAVGFNAASYVGYLVNHMDLSPNFSGQMMGITNGISNLLSIFAPLMVTAVVKDESQPSEWRIVFFITAGFYLVCNTVFLIFGKAEIQSWNSPKKIDNYTSTTNIINTQTDDDTQNNNKTNSTYL